MKDTRFARFVIFVNGVVPLALLLHDAYYHRLGANPSEFAIRTTGTLALLFLILSLAVTPLRKSLGQPWVVKFRRMVGLFGCFCGALHYYMRVKADTREPLLFAAALGLLLLYRVANKYLPSYTERKPARPQPRRAQGV